MGRFKTVFTKEQEDELVSYLLQMETTLFGNGIADLRKIAYDLAERNSVRHKFSKDLQQIGIDSVRGFRKRHPQCLQQTPFYTSANFNCHETVISTVSKTGRKQVGALSSAERGQLFTAEMRFSAARQYIPPMLIFSRQRMKQELVDGAPPGAVARLCGSAYAKAVTVTTAINTFAKTGTWPLNENVFSDGDFAASDVTEREQPESETINAARLDKQIAKDCQNLHQAGMPHMKLKIFVQFLKDDIKELSVKKGRPLC
ncbi:hypothetical protein ILUMI_01757 [Ignelater luminosus]|uniref:Uncharacterized protein n=1 Tax=Ignelater luminosus TaxID=2038154 RepID=A0A8K0DQ34_IGNLU|nr:hypothetical protein ILUMI_01757 [Ignelater luminosus]